MKRPANITGNIACSCLVFAVCVLVASANLIGQEAQGVFGPKRPDQIWYGVLDVKVAQLRLAFEVYKSDRGALSGQLISLDQGKSKVKLDRITVADGKLQIEVKAAAGRFEGRLDDAGKTAKGKWTQGGRSFDLVLKLVKAIPQEKPREVWEGTLVAGKRKLKLRFRIFGDPQGKSTAKFDSLNEGVSGVQANVTRQEGKLKFEVPVLKAGFEGTLNREGDTATGNWLQGGAKFPMTFKKVDVKTALSTAKPKRPQTPKPPFPYDAIDVTFENTADRVTLAGTFTLPKQADPEQKANKFPAVILISGSGPQDRNETLLGHQPFLIIADHLSRHGIAVLRFDDRGVGESSGDFAAATSADFARDVRAGIEFLNKNDRVDPKRIGLIGHSEGGIIAPLAAVESDDVAFLVLLAGTGVTGEEIIYSQSTLIAKTQGAADEAIEENRRLQKLAIAKLREAPQDADTDKLVEQILDEFTQSYPEDQRQAKRPHALAAAGLRQLASPWFRFFLDHDPRSVLQKVKCPVLALNGEKDLQVEPDLNLGEIEKALKAGGNQQGKFVKLPGLNHLFQHAETGLPSDYGQIEETFAPGVLKLMTEWILDL